jgi:hypothetical protein
MSINLFHTFFLLLLLLLKLDENKIKIMQEQVL